jgi:hypothetical protein
MPDIDFNSPSRCICVVWRSRDCGAPDPNRNVLARDTVHGIPDGYVTADAACSQCSGTGFADTIESLARTMAGSRSDALARLYARTIEAQVAGDKNAGAFSWDGRLGPFRARYDALIARERAKAAERAAHPVYRIDTIAHVRDRDLAPASSADAKRAFIAELDRMTAGGFALSVPLTLDTPPCEAVARAAAEAAISKAIVGDATTDSTPAVPGRVAFFVHCLLAEGLIHEIQRDNLAGTLDACIREGFMRVRDGGEEGIGSFLSGHCHWLGEHALTRCIEFVERERVGLATAQPNAFEHLTTVVEFVAEWRKWVLAGRGETEMWIRALVDDVKTAPTPREVANAVLEQLWKTVPEDLVRATELFVLAERRKGFARENGVDTSAKTIPPQAPAPSGLARPANRLRLVECECVTCERIRMSDPSALPTDRLIASVVPDTDGFFVAFTQRDCPDCSGRGFRFIEGYSPKNVAGVRDLARVLGMPEDANEGAIASRAKGEIERNTPGSEPIDPVIFHVGRLDAALREIIATPPGGTCAKHELAIDVVHRMRVLVDRLAKDVPALDDAMRASNRYRLEMETRAGAGHPVVDDGLRIDVQLPDGEEG